MGTVLVLLLVAVVVVFAVKDIRMNVISRPAFRIFKKVLPPLSDTERQAMEAGDIWWDGELFSGKPDWQALFDLGQPKLSAEEQAFLDEKVEPLLAMLDDYDIVHNQRDLPKPVWNYLKEHGFFAMIIPKSYGGLEFSAIANSTIVARIATQSLSAAVTVMVPNSLGPGELLMHYGTEEQKSYWLPKLSSGEVVPCFALTGPDAGSDAGAIPDSGIVCEGEHEGKTVTGIRLTWDKRYITLAPVADVLGLAFKLYDPDGLLGDEANLGITCALIPTSHPGVNIGKRHDPLSMAFMNGVTSGEDVFIPIDWIIGGPAFAGRGWRMLVECLSAGRGISLPALGTATGHLATRMTSAYAMVRKQFGVSIGQFEGIQEALGRIGGNNYTLEAMRVTTAGSIDLNLSPSVITAIAKYHMTELSRTIINDAFDVHAGKAIQLGPNNYLGHSYMGTPISITVEGANILTRNLMIFGQGATRCHPYVLKEMAAAANPDEEQGLKEFDGLLLSHILHAGENAVMSVFHGLTRSHFAPSPVSGEVSHYYKLLGRMSRALAVSADIAMLTLGGDLKRREMISARLGDVLSQLYIGSCVLRYFEEQGRQQADLPFVRYGVEQALYKIGIAFEELGDNYPNKVIGFIIKRLALPLGNHFKKPSDDTLKAICDHLSTPSVCRDRLTHLCYVGEGDGKGIMEHAFLAMHEAKDVYQTLNTLRKGGKLGKTTTISEAAEKARYAKLITDEEAERVLNAESLKNDAIAVDAFDTL